MFIANMLRIVIELDEVGLNASLVHSLLHDYGAQRRALFGLLKEEGFQGAYPSTSDGRLRIIAERIVAAPR